MILIPSTCYVMTLRIPGITERTLNLHADGCTACCWVRRSPRRRQAEERGALSLSAVKVQAQSQKADYGPSLCSCKYLLRKKQSCACCTSLAESCRKACSTGRTLRFCKNAAADSSMLFGEKWVLGWQADLFCQTPRPFQALPAYAAWVLHSCKVGTLPEAAFLGPSDKFINASLQALQTFSAIGFTWIRCTRCLAKPVRPHPQSFDICMMHKPFY